MNPLHQRARWGAGAGTFCFAEQHSKWVGTCSCRCCGAVRWQWPYTSFNFHSVGSHHRHILSQTPVSKSFYWFKLAHAKCREWRSVPSKTSTAKFHSSTGQFLSFGPLYMSILLNRQLVCIWRCMASAGFRPQLVTVSANGPGSYLAEMKWIGDVQTVFLIRCSIFWEVRCQMHIRITRVTCWIGDTIFVYTVLNTNMLRR